jgi:hypothetical protein
MPIIAAAPSQKPQLLSKQQTILALPTVPGEKICPHSIKLLSAAYNAVSANKKIYCSSRKLLTEQTSKSPQQTMGPQVPGRA